MGLVSNEDTITKLRITSDITVGKFVEHLFSPVTTTPSLKPERTSEHEWFPLVDAASVRKRCCQMCLLVLNLLKKHLQMEEMRK